MRRFGRYGSSSGRGSGIEVPKEDAKWAIAKLMDVAKIGWRGDARQFTMTYKFEVGQSGAGCTTAKTIKIQFDPKELADPARQKAGLVKLYFTMLHEIGHSYYKLMGATYRKKLEAEFPGYAQFTAPVLNFVEDIVLNFKLACDMPGFGDFAKEAIEEFIDSWPYLEDLLKRSQSDMVFEACRQYCFSRKVKCQGKTEDILDADLVYALRRSAKLAQSPCYTKKAGEKECFEAAREIVKLLIQYIESPKDIPEPPVHADPEPTEPGEPGEPGDSPVPTDQPQIQKQPPQEQPEQPKEDQPKQPGNSPSPKQDEPEEEEKPEKGDGQGEPEEPQEPEPQQGHGDGPISQLPLEEPEQPPQGQGEGKDDPKEEPESKDDSEGKDGEDPKEDGEEKPAKADDHEEPDDEAPDDEEEPLKHYGEGDADEEEPDDEEEAAPDKPAPIDKVDDTKVAERKKEIEDTNYPFGKMTPEQIAKMSKAIQAAASQDAKIGHGAGSGRGKQLKYDKRRDVPMGQSQTSILSQASALAQQMYNRIQDRLGSEVNTISLSKHGTKISSAGYRKMLLTGNTRIFEKHIDISEIGKNFASIFVMDVSGSMMGAGTNLAMGAMSKFLWLAGATFAQECFESDVVLVKDFNDTYSMADCTFPHFGGGGTMTWKALSKAVRLLKVRSEPIKILFLVTDGDDYPAKQMEIANIFAMSAQAKIFMKLILIGSQSHSGTSQWFEPADIAEPDSDDMSGVPAVIEKIFGDQFVKIKKEILAKI